MNNFVSLSFDKQSLNQFVREARALQMAMTAQDIDLAQAAAVTSSTSLKMASTAKGPVCKVCGDVASGFHYGVDSCEGCKVNNAHVIYSYDIIVVKCSSALF